MEFRPIPGFEPYEISREGVVRRRLPARGGTRNGKSVPGYVLAVRRGRVTLRTDANNTTRSVASLLWTAFGTGAYFGDLSDEEWRSVLGWERIYEVSNMGRVRRVRIVRGGNNPGHVLKAGANTSGYLCVRLTAGQRRQPYTIHRLVLSAFVGPRPARAQVNHLNGIKADNRLANLEWCSQSANMRHAWRTGLRSRKSDRH